MATDRGRVLIIIPAFNEALSVGTVIDETRLHMPAADILVVDDGSTDATSAIALRKGVQVVSLPFNCGIGVTMQTGYLVALQRGYDIAIQVDGDGQHNPADLPLLVAPLLDGKADMVIGSRFLGSGYRSSAARRVGILWISTLVGWLTGNRFSDPTSGYRAANRAVIALFAAWYPTDYPEPEVITPLVRSGYGVVEIPVTMRPRQHGSSSITPLRSAYYMAKVTLAILVGFARGSGAREAKCQTEYS